jgi:hypothetical protein
LSSRGAGIGWQQKCPVADRGFITSSHERVACFLPRRRSACLKLGSLGKKAVGCNARSGPDSPHTVVLAMRYVIVIAAIAFFLIWDGLYNHGYYLDQTVRETSRIVRSITG